DEPLLWLLIEYLIDRDTSKIENLDLFDLLPRNFISKLDQFKDQFITSTKLKRLINQEMSNLEEYINPSNLEPTSKEFAIEEEKVKETLVEEKEGRDEGILEQLKLAKQENIASLKKSIKSSISGGITKSAETSEVAQIQEETEKVMTTEFSEETLPSQVDQSPSPPPEESTQTDSRQHVEEISEQKMETLDTEAMLIKKSGYFLDYFGEFPEVDASNLEDFKINRLNLITSRDNNPSFLDLQNLYYYISILKMLNVDLPFPEEKINSLLEEYTENGLFVSKPKAASDPISIFYGLSILSEYNVLNKTDIIDVLEIEMFLEGELSKFIPEKLHLNFYTLLGLKILEKHGSVITPKSNLSNPLLNLKVREFENYNPPLDLFEKISLIKLLDPSADLSHFKGLYTNELKKAILSSEKKINSTISDAARTFLTLKLLDLSKQEFKLMQNLREYISTKTEYFGQEDMQQEFNWKADMHAYKVELRMLYWALITCY
ncbi:MAG: hypothetical protein ACOC44_14345, partial [Promethearchaeia archaeon]